MIGVDLALRKNSRVAVVDDDRDGCAEVIDLLAEYGFDGAPLEGRFERPEDMVLAVKQLAPAFVICDNRLQPQGMANFFGVTVVQKLMAEGCPAMLLTTYASSDRRMLRKARYDVPVVVRRDVFVPDLLSSYYEVCQREISEDPVDERRPHRSLIRVDRLQDGELDVVVPSWRPDHAIPIPVDCIDLAIRDIVQPGMYLLGDVNIGALDEDELFFNLVNEVAPEPKVLRQ